MTAGRAAVALAVLCTLAAPTASAQGWRPAPPPDQAPSKEMVAEARLRFRKGVQLIEEETNPEAALVEFQRAYDLAPSYRLFYNIAQASRGAKDYAGALRAYEHYLAQGGARLARPRRAEVERDVAQLRAFVATVALRVEPPGAEVAINGQPLGVAPLPEPLVLNAGRLRFVATYEGRSGVRTIDVAGGDVVALTLTLDEAPPAAAAADGAGRAVRPPSTRPAGAPPARAASRAWLGWAAATTAFAAGAGVTGLVALDASNDLAEARYYGAAPPRDVTDLRDRVRTYSVASDVLAGAAVVTLGVTVYAALTARGTGASPTSAARPSPPTSAAPQVVVGPGGTLLLMGSF